MKKLFMMALVGSFLLVAARARAEFVVKVECWGSNCMNVQFGDICGNDYSAVSVSCAQPADPVSGDWGFSCGDATCQRRGMPSTYDYLGYFCNDTGGYDAIVVCR